MVIDDRIENNPMKFLIFRIFLHMCALYWNGLYVEYGMWKLTHILHSMSFFVLDNLRWWSVWH